MIAHKLIDDLEPAFPGELQNIRDAQKFDIGDVGKLETDYYSVMRFARDGLAHLPYKHCLFEMRSEGINPMAIMGVETDNKIHFLFYWLDDGGKSVGANALTTFDKNTATFSCRRISSGEGPISDKECLAYEVNIIAVLYFCTAIRCTNTRMPESKPSERLNKKRKKKGKCPLFSYKTLVLKTHESDAASGATGSHRDGPRVHLRRGHIRRIGDGRMTWVQPCVVGDKKRGIVMKDYKLQQKVGA